MIIYLYMNIHFFFIQNEIYLKLMCTVYTDQNARHYHLSVFLGSKIYSLRNVSLKSKEIYEIILNMFNNLLCNLMKFYE